eukprot:gene3458-3687_t
MIPSSFLLLFCSLANVIAHLGKDIIGRPNFLPHPAEVKIMDGSFPSNPSYVIVQFSMDLSTCAAANVFAYYAYVLNTCVTSNSSSSSSIITCDGGVATETTYYGKTCETVKDTSEFYPGCQFGFSVYACGVGPYDYREGDYLVEGIYETNICTNQIANMAIVSEVCTQEYTIGGSSIIKGLTSYYYKKSSSCSGSYTTKSSDQCTLQSDESLKDYQSYLQYSSMSVESSSDDNKLSTTAIGGIVIAVLFSGIIIIAAGIVYWNKQRLQGHQKLATNESLTTELMASNFSVNL